MLKESDKQNHLKVQLVSPYDDYVPDFYWTFRSESNDIGDALRAEVDLWDARNPIMLEAPTGMGKSSLVFHELIPRAQAAGKNVLLISNRVAISTQQKLILMELTQSPLSGMLTEKGIRATEQFGNVCVISYHKLPAFLNNPENSDWIHNIMYAVADECHYLVADSNFNSDCNYHLTLMTSKLQMAIRVYMTATSWDVLQPLAEAEEMNNRDFPARLTGALKGYYPEPRCFLRYEFPTSYDHIDLKFYSEWDEIEQLISLNPSEQWLVFVDSKAKGKELGRKLGAKALYLDADSKASEAWNSLLVNESFEQQVLFCTSALDCGINIKSSRLKNVEAMTDDRTSLIQMVGRKRCRPGERITLYVYDMPLATIARRYARLSEVDCWYTRYLDADHLEQRKIAHILWRTDDSYLRQYFDLTFGGNLVPNKLAIHKLRRKLVFYRRFMDEDGKFTKSTMFKDSVCSWLKKDPQERPDYVALLEAFCQSHEDNFEENDLDKLRDLITSACTQEGYKEAQPKRILGVSALNTRLDRLNLPFSLEKTTENAHSLRRKL